MAKLVIEALSCPQCGYLLRSATPGNCPACGVYLNVFSEGEPVADRWSKMERYPNTVDMVISTMQFVSTFAYSFPQYSTSTGRMVIDQDNLIIFP